MSKGMDCPLCGQKDAKFITRDLRFEKNADVYECLQCELVFLDQNSFQLPAGFYENKYHQSYLTHVEPDALDPKAYFEKMSTTVVSGLVLHIPGFISKSPLRYTREAAKYIS